MSYPILEERRLSPAARGLWGGSRRDRQDLPTLPPRATYVLRTATGVHDLGDTYAIDVRDPRLAAGGVITVVDLARRELSVQLSLPSATLPEEFLLTVRFGCRVIDAQAVAAAEGTSDLGTHLRQYLSSDGRLTSISRSFESDQTLKAILDVEAWIRIRVEDSPPSHAVEITVVDIVLSSPSGVQTHLSDVLRDRRENELKAQARARRTVEADAALEAIAGGPDRIEAQALASGAISWRDIVERSQRETERAHTDAVNVLLEAMKQGHGKGADIDIEGPAGRILGGLGRGTPSTGAALEDGRRDLPVDREPQDDERPRYLPSEDDDD